ncbi:Pyruvate kinase [Anoxybacillus sp. BCO1]|nr:Pyruvate kinase [Anoxybacillus sp. BCO1]
MRKTKIVCTIGPASESVEKLVQLIEAGMNVARLNFSHGSHEEHAARIRNIREASKITGKTVAILLDTKGPEIRTHNMENGAIELKAGSEVTISMKEVLGTPEKFSITYEGLIDDVHVGSTILLDDGLIGLEVLAIDKEAKEIRTKVLNGGVLKNKKGVNVPGVKVKLPGLLKKTQKIFVSVLNKALISLLHRSFAALLTCLKFVNCSKNITRCTFKLSRKLKTKKA